MKLTMSSEAAEGNACVVCNKPGDARQGQRCGPAEGGGDMWVCFGGCQMLLQMFAK